MSWEWKVPFAFCFPIFTKEAREGNYQTLVAGTWTETKKMYLGGFFLKLADDDV